jgi:hypothetical protein
MMVNFQRVLGQIKTPHDDVVILGDMVYPEQKRVGKSILGLRSTGTTKLASETDKTKVEAWTKLSKIRRKKAVVPDVEYDYLTESGSKEKLIVTPKYDGVDADSLKAIELLREREVRLDCGWRYLLALLNDSTVTPAWVLKAMQFVFGNHTYDVDYRFEAKFISKNFEKSVTHRVPDDGHKVSEYVTTPFNFKLFLKPRIVKSNSVSPLVEYIGILIINFF